MNVKSSAYYFLVKSQITRFQICFSAWGFVWFSKNSSLQKYMLMPAGVARWRWVVFQTDLLPKFIPLITAKLRQSAREVLKWKIIKEIADEDVTILCVIGRWLEIARPSFWPRWSEIARPSFWSELLTVFLSGTSCIPWVNLKWV